jgi:monofunctional glycosyltransferase
VSLWLQHLTRLALLVLVCSVALQLYFAGRIALMAIWDPQSTTFQRSEARRLFAASNALNWQQSWLDYPQISAHLKRAVIAAEDSGFVEHGGVEWDALESAWGKNQAAQQWSLQRKKRTHKIREPKLVGGSTITQQLAKNLFLNGERSLLRKGQEMAITFMLEAVLSKQRILEIYLNSVEWGAGVFGAQAAARHYLQTGAGQLSPFAAARLAVMLPAPKRFEKNPTSNYILHRASTIQGRMVDVELPQ